MMSDTSFDDARAMIEALTPSYPIYCLRPDLLTAMAKQFLDHFPGRVLYAVKCNPHPLVLQALYDAGIRHFDVNDPEQGIVHVIGPELGLTLPGLLITCGDSHTSTHGALGALAFGIGSTEIAHVLATQTIVQKKPRTMRVAFEGALPPGVTPKDMILHLIGTIGTAGGDGHAVEYAGAAIRAMPIEGRLTICNMSIEFGAKMGQIAPDDTTYEYLSGRRFAPSGAAWCPALTHWRTLPTDAGAQFDREIAIDVARIEPQITWGTSPENVVPITGAVPDPDNDARDDNQRQAWERSLEYMDLAPGTAMQDVTIDKVFIGSCTNGRIEDLREAAKIAEGRKVAASVYAMIVPGSGLVKLEAEEEGLDRIFKEAGFEWRDAGCSMCLAMNEDILLPGERCASTSNRNFEGRQGRGGRTHLVSPQMAVAAAIEGRFVDVREWQ